eukprot:s3324_g3.t1
MKGGGQWVWAWVPAIAPAHLPLPSDAVAMLVPPRVEQGAVLSEQEPPVKAPGPANLEQEPPVKAPGPVNLEQEPPVKAPGPVNSEQEPPVKAPCPATLEQEPPVKAPCPATLEQEPPLKAPGPANHGHVPRVVPALIPQPTPPNYPPPQRNQVDGEMERPGKRRKNEDTSGMPCPPVMAPQAMYPKTEPEVLSVPDDDDDDEDNDDDKDDDNEIYDNQYTYSYRGPCSQMLDELDEKYGSEPEWSWRKKSWYKEQSWESEEVEEWGNWKNPNSSGWRR